MALYNPIGGRWRRSYARLPRTCQSVVGHAYLASAIRLLFPPDGKPKAISKASGAPMTSRRILLVTFAFSCFTHTAGNAQSTCAKFQGQLVKAVDIDEVLAPFKNLQPKGEFETTAEFNARTSTLFGARANKEYIIKKTPDNADKFIVYDADAGELIITRWAFSNINLDIFSAFSAAKPAGVKYSINNIKVVISAVEKTTGTHVKSNAYGKSVDIITVDKATKAIFVREAKNVDDSLFPSASRSPYIVGKIKMPPDVAKKVKPEIGLAFVAIPKEPFAAFGIDRSGEATISHPIGITETFSILIADIKCGLVLDVDSRVLAAFQTDLPAQGAWQTQPATASPARAPGSEAGGSSATQGPETQSPPSRVDKLIDDILNGKPR